MNPPASTLAGCLDDYLILRRALGCKLIRAERYLRQFLDYLGERELDTLTVEAAADWVSQSRHGSAAPGLGMEAVRGFAVFLHAHDPAHEVPPPGLFPRRRVRAVVPPRDRSARMQQHPSSQPCKSADSVDVRRLSPFLRHPGALLVTMLAVTDLAYRLLLRERVRRVLGMRH